MALEESSEQKVDRRCAKILIEVYLHDGRFKEILLDLHGSSVEEKVALLEDTIIVFFLQTGWPCCERLLEPWNQLWKLGAVQKIVG